ncbi:MAG: F0F1 ATP synthase subunit delta [Gammaproteobacteria bacterium]|nr:F0F1 ATP synthase subunit delta [Gammaproteobacteria bacterium]
MFSNMTTLARPYAVAAFETALEKDNLTSWKNMLNNAAQVIQDNQVATLLDNPKVTTKQLIELICDVLTPVLDTEKKNFLHLLAEYKRLPLLPNIVTLFTTYCAEHEKYINVDVISAVTLDATYQQKLVQSLTKRLQRNVSLHCTVDPKLLGGILVRAGDTVIDGSVRGKLNRLLESL